MLINREEVPVMNVPKLIVELQLLLSQRHRLLKTTSSMCSVHCPECNLIAIIIGHWEI